MTLNRTTKTLLLAVAIAAIERVAAQMKRLMTLDLASSSGCSDLRAKLALMRRMAIEGEVAATANLAR